MRHRLLAGLALAAVLANSAAAAPAPLMKQLDRFASPDVPAMAPTETEAPRGAWNEAPPPGLPGKGLAQHPMLYIGEGYNKMFVIRDGKVIWTYSTGGGWEYDDIWMMTNGNILFTRQQYVAIVTPEKKVIWRYDAPPGTEIHTAQPIGLNKVMFVVNGLPPKLMIINIKTGKLEVSHDLPAQSQTDQRTVHGQFRRARYTAQGTYLLSFLNLNRVVEYDKNFKEIWRYEAPGTWAAVRLKNGNTLITVEREHTTREVNPKGETVWELKPEDLPEAYRFAGTQSATRLANGNTIICSRGRGGKGVQLVEVTREKKVVWVLQDWTVLGPATAVQILDEPVRPEIPGQSQH